MVRAAINYVYCVDGELLKKMDKQKYVIACLGEYIEMLLTKKNELKKCRKNEKRHF